MTSVTLESVLSLSEKKWEVEELKTTNLNIISGNFALKKLHWVDRKITQGEK